MGKIQRNPDYRGYFLIIGILAVREKYPFKFEDIANK